MMVSQVPLKSDTTSVSGVIIKGEEEGLLVLCSCVEVFL